MKYLEIQSKVFMTGDWSVRTRVKCEPTILQYTHRHTTRESVSLILWKFPNTGWCVDWLKRERRGREEMMGKEGKMSSSIKSPYVYSLSSIAHPGVRARQAQVWAGRPDLGAVALGLAASGLPLLGLPLLQGPFLLDASADLLLKPAHLLLELTDEIYHTLGGQEQRRTNEGQRKG